MSLENYGLVWNNIDLRLLKVGMERGEDLPNVAKDLGRSPAACDHMWREMRRMEMMQHGSPVDNLRTWTKKQRENQK